MLRHVGVRSCLSSRHSVRQSSSPLCQQATSRVQTTQTKSRPKAALNATPMGVDHAAIKAGFDFRRYVMKPMPAKPMIIIAHVEGSGTALARLLPMPGLVIIE